MMYRCRICGIYYEEWEIAESIWSPCCGSSMDLIERENIPDTDL